MSVLNFLKKKENASNGKHNNDEKSLVHENGKNDYIRKKH